MRLSKKLGVTIGASVAIALNDRFRIGLSEQTIYIIAGIVGTYVLGQSGVDVAKNMSDAKVRVAEVTPAPAPPPAATSVTVTQEAKP